MFVKYLDRERERERERERTSERARAREKARERKKEREKERERERERERRKVWLNDIYNKDYKRKTRRSMIDYEKKILLIARYEILTHPSRLLSFLCVTEYLDTFMDYQHVLNSVKV